MIRDVSIKNVLVPLIEHFVSASVSLVELFEDSYRFKTSMGENGIILKNIVGNWDIVVNDEIIYEIEDEVMEALVPSNGKFLLHEYYGNLINLISSVNLKYRSKILIQQIKNTTEYLILNSNIKPEIPIKIGPFLVSSNRIIGRNLITLN